MDAEEEELVIRVGGVHARRGWEWCELAIRLNVASPTGVVLRSLGTVNAEDVSLGELCYALQAARELLEWGKRWTTLRAFDLVRWP